MNPARVEVGTPAPYSVLVGPGVLAEVRGCIDPATEVFVLADARVQALHGSALACLEDAPRLDLEGGESAKTVGRLGEVLEAMAAAGLSRSATLVTFGGGSIGDLGGLAASLYKRGTQVVHCPTTLLAQVDASVGGKTAVNLSAGKNLAGTFHQPRAVFADTEVLGTLPGNELTSGLGEVVKTALLGGAPLLADLEQAAKAAPQENPTTLGPIIAACVEVKARIVVSDPEERGPRRALNLGHTFAHAIEFCAGYGAIPHGVAVAVGLVLALRASALTGRLRVPDLEPRVLALLEDLGLPTSLDELRRTSNQKLEASDLQRGLAHDKKGAVGRPEFVLLEDLGEPALGVVLDETLMCELLS